MCKCICICIYPVMKYGNFLWSDIVTVSGKSVKEKRANSKKKKKKNQQNSDIFVRKMRSIA